MTYLLDMLETVQLDDTLPLSRGYVVQQEQQSDNTVDTPTVCIQYAMISCHHLLNENCIKLSIDLCSHDTA